MSSIVSREGGALSAPGDTGCVLQNTSKKCFAVLITSMSILHASYNVLTSSRGLFSRNYSFSPNHLLHSQSFITF